MLSGLWASALLYLDMDLYMYMEMKLCSDFYIGKFVLFEDIFLRSIKVEHSWLLKTEFLTEKFPAIILTILLLSKHFDIRCDKEHSPQGRVEQDHQGEGATNICAPWSSHNNLILSNWEAPFCLAHIELLCILFPFGQLSGFPLNSLERLQMKGHAVNCLRVGFLFCLGL